MDYKHRIPDYRYRSERKKSRVGLWATLAIIVVFIAVAAGWAVTRHKEEPITAAQQENPPAKIDANPVALPAKPAEAKPGVKKPDKANDANPGSATLAEPRFTFYKILPEKEAIVPESEITNLKQAESQGNKPRAGQYLLQAGSFANPQDAVKMKEKLTALKIKSHIENVKIENAAWNRVKIGPFTSLADADKVRTYLRNNQIDSVVQKAVSKPPQTPTKR